MINVASGSIEPATVTVADIHTSEELLFMGGYMAIRICAVDGNGRKRFVKDMTRGFFRGNESCGVVGPGNVDVFHAGAAAVSHGVT